MSSQTIIDFRITYILICYIINENLLRKLTGEKNILASRFIFAFDLITSYA